MVVTAIKDPTATTNGEDLDITQPDPSQTAVDSGSSPTPATSMASASEDGGSTPPQCNGTGVSHDEKMAASKKQNSVITSNGISSSSDDKGKSKATKAKMAKRIKKLEARIKALKDNALESDSELDLDFASSSDDTAISSTKQVNGETKATETSETKKQKPKGTKLEFVRIDHVWDESKNAYVDKETQA